MMKRNTLTVLLTAILLLCFLTATAQTDVTSLYLSNAGFDVEGDFVSSVVYTYAKDGPVSSCQPVTAWTADATGDAKAGGAFAFGSGCGLSGTSYVVPTTDADGNSAGGALGLAACWSPLLRLCRLHGQPEQWRRRLAQCHHRPKLQVRLLGALTRGIRTADYLYSNKSKKNNAATCAAGTPLAYPISTFWRS